MVYKKVFLLTYEKDQGVIFADTEAQAQATKRFLRARGTMVEVMNTHGLELVRVLGGYGDIAKTEAEVRALRSAPLNTTTPAE